MTHLKTKYKQTGLTLIELLIVVAIIGIIGSSSFYVSSNFLVENHLENKTNELISLLQSAQINSMSGKEDSNWGVYISDTKLILYKGDSYSLRDQPFDESYDIPATIEITNGDINFDNPTGIPSSTATITARDNKNKTNTITINEMGIADLL